MSETIARTYGNCETAFEKELLKRFLSFSKKRHKMHQRIKPLAKRYYHEQHLMEEHDAATKKFEQRYRDMQHTIEGFKNVSRSMGIDMSEFNALSVRYHKVTEKYLEYHSEKVDPWREMLQKTEAEFRNLHQWFDKEEEIRAYDYMKDYADELYKNYDNYALDLCQFDDDVDEMNGERDKADKQWYDLFDLREKTVAMQIPVCARLEKINKLLKNVERDIIGMNESRLMFNN